MYDFVVVRILYEYWSVSVVFDTFYTVLIAAIMICLR